MIIGTAGHIDHGKTTLVRALTGVDTDRLPEEKKRGISIELGYAFMDDGAGGKLGFIDVPGHERLVHTMLAGATGIDHALLLVAADDGVMPQTREHLAVLSLLGLRSATVVITKCDRADAARVLGLKAEMFELLAGTGLDASPMFEVAAHSGVGLDALRQHLQALAREGRGGQAHHVTQGFRLAVDRVFSLDGVGTVATGSIHAGQVSEGDELLLVPPAPGQSPRPARVRSLHAQNQSVRQAHAGQRCALGLVGVDRAEVARGQCWVAPEIAFCTQRLDVQLRLWPGEAKPLRSGSSVHVHLGSATLMGTVAVLEAALKDSLAPGAQALVQLVLHQPVAAWAGDRVVLRDASASRTMAGGRVLDPVAPARYRRTPERLAELAALALDTPQQRLHALLNAAPLGLDLAQWATVQGLSSAGRQDVTLPDDALSQQGAAGHEDSHWILGANQATALAEHALQVLAVYHAQHPDELGPDTARWRRLAAPRLAESLWRALLQRLQQAGRVVLRGAAAHLPEHGVQLSAADERVAQKIAPLLRSGGFEGAWARDLARDTQTPEPLMRVSLSRLAQGGSLHQVVKDLYYAAPAMAQLAQLARQAIDGEGAIKAAAFRDAAGLGRKRAIQILEYFDRVGLTRRVGDTHKLRADSKLFSAECEG
ncbi:selenocysteine-specific translation elongation factor [Roseateles koreensis]|uniref:Selenocysteine-specific elongation factor n=1 Tax=Roseateles koreensis TaxID=2987526 RepID=A0ABT5KPF7_9BURK|nr:selenocysteine-specific translation elongation factor [Roseateles koreensis]MDC8783726.1 selenocysteine-specific translation elongation factor [Roseateles koreensis]